jgi:alpha-mannosidase
MLQRRELLKRLSMAIGGAVCASPVWPMLGTSQEKNKEVPLATPIRGLSKRQGALLQPIQITVQHIGSDATAITTLDGTDVDRRVLTAGTQSFRILIPPVSATRTATIEVTVAGKVHSATVKLHPVRKILIYVLPHSHHDLGYTALQSDVEEKQMQNITKGIELARKTADYPDGAQFIWNLEVLWGADLFMRRRPPAEKEEFVKAVKKGWLALNGMYANELTGLCRPEELLQLFRYSGELSDLCGVSVNSAMLSDVPGFTWGTVTAMAQAGIRYFSAAPNFFDRIGSFMERWQDKPFWWLSPSSTNRVLVWVPWTGYAMSHLMKPNDEWVGKYQERLDSVKFPYEISHIRWSGHGDNAEPDPGICEFVKSWNEEYEWPKFRVSSTGAAFSAFEERYGDELPQFKGDLTPYWEDGAGSSALETGMNRAAADRLTQAASMTAILAAENYRPAVFHEAWRNVLLFSEHTWGAWCSVSDSESAFTVEQWKVKREFAVNAEKQSKELLRAILGSYGVSEIKSAVDVHNSTSWVRSEVTVLSPEMSPTGDHVSDDRGVSVPSQRLVSGELAFLPNRVPAFGSARFHISAAPPHKPPKIASIRNGVLENGIVRARFDLNTGNLVEFALHGQAGNLVDASEGGVNKFLFLDGKNISEIETSGPCKVVVEESGPLVVSLRIESSAPGCKSLVRRARLIAGADWIELTNVVDKKRAPLNPHLGQGGPGDEFAQRGAKESVQFAFPFAVPAGKMHIDIPLGTMQPEIDQLPGSCKNWLPVGRWIDVADSNKGVTWVSLDAPLVEVGGVTATMLGSETNPIAWRENIAPTQKFYSWAMNNHWGTNYRAYQEGVVEFRYALRPHRGYDPAACSRLAIGLSQPLVASAAGANSPAQSLLQIEPADVLVLGFKRSDDGEAWIVRLFGASGASRRAKVRWSNGISARMWLSDMTERKGKPLDEDVEVAGWDLLTLRIELA